MAKAAIFFADGLEEIEGLTVVDMLRRANIDITIVSVTGDLVIKGSHGITVIADKLYDEMNFAEIEMFILPGGMPGTKHLRACEQLCELLREVAAEGRRYIAAICAAPSVLGELGLLKGVKATCYPGHELKLHGAVLSTDNVVIDGRFITSRGMGTAIEFSAQLIEVLKDGKCADQLLAAIMYKH